jgi:hypothetical protein
MTDRSQMLQGSMNPVALQGVISSKGFIDSDLVHEFQQNAADPRIAAKCYPGGQDEINHNLLPGDLSFSQKCVRNGDVGDGEPNELGVSSVAGLCWGNYCSQREMEDDYYLSGVVTTESRLTNPLDSTTSDPNHGYGMIVAGTHTVINNGPYPFYPGTPIAWRFPPAPIHPKANGDLFNGGSTVNMLARQGAPTGQFRPELVPFDPLDFSVHMAAAFAAITSDQGEGGVADVPFSKAMPGSDMGRSTGASSRPWSCIQDEALSYKYGLAGIGLTMVETLIRQGVLQVTNNVPNLNATAAASALAHAAASDLAGQLGLWNTAGAAQGPLREFFADLMLKNIGCGDPARTAAVQRFYEATGGREFYKIATEAPQTTEQMYARLRAHQCEMLTQGLGSSWNSKTSKIVGRALAYAAPADSLHAVWGHHTQ